ncbi:hypothetical protein EYF80_067572 [Liparis tanakae]|uniref:Uncharacterized protein n=1 Tax=Liparis tanakae TaxID=230148 RepID=A0A4Z2E0N9_9TELE|nr:hypothetical protein EYF80_067572 [Liparis tanakae]
MSWRRFLPPRGGATEEEEHPPLMFLPPRGGATEEEEHPPLMFLPPRGGATEEEVSSLQLSGRTSPGDTSHVLQSPSPGDTSHVLQSPSPGDTPHVLQLCSRWPGRLWCFFPLQSYGFSTNHEKCTENIPQIGVP